MTDIVKAVVHDILQFGQGVYTTYENTPNSLTPIYQLVVETGRVWSPNSRAPFWLELWCQDLGLTPSAGSVTLTYGNLIPPKANGDDEDPGVTEVLVGTVGGVKKRLTITAHTANTISFSDTLDTGTTVDAFYIPATPGQLVLSYARPDLIGDYGRAFMAIDTRVFAQHNPFNRQSFIPFRSPSVWPGDWILWFRLKAPWKVAWQDTADTPAALPIRWQIPIVIEPRHNYPPDLEHRVTDSLIMLE